MNWTPAQLTYLLDNYGKMDLYLLAWKLRRKEDAVKQKYRQLLKQKE
jgi:hypothetical protein